MVGSQETQRCHWLVAVFWRKNKETNKQKILRLLRQLCVHNYSNYDYDDDNNKKIFISHLSVSCVLFTGLFWVLDYFLCKIFALRASMTCRGPVWPPPCTGSSSRDTWIKDTCCRFYLFIFIVFYFETFSVLFLVIFLIWKRMNSSLALINSKIQ